MMNYFKKDIGSSCRKCSKSRFRGDDIDYMILGQTLCKEHAQHECDKNNIPLPNSRSLSSTDQNIVDFLRNNLQLTVRYSGGCPEENSQADRDIFLILDGEVISEINL